MTETDTRGGEHDDATDGQEATAARVRQAREEATAAASGFDRDRERPAPRGRQVSPELLSEAVQKHRPARRRQAKKRQEAGIDLPGIQ